MGNSIKTSKTRQNWAKQAEPEQNLSKTLHGTEVEPKRDPAKLTWSTPRVPKAFEALICKFITIL